jgi:hypothetical protein
MGSPARWRNDVWPVPTLSARHGRSDCNRLPKAGFESSPITSTITLSTRSWAISPSDAFAPFGG